MAGESGERDLPEEVEKLSCLKYMLHLNFLSFRLPRILGVVRPSPLLLREDFENFGFLAVEKPQKGQMRESLLAPPASSSVRRHARTAAARQRTAISEAKQGELS